MVPETGSIRPQLNPVPVAEQQPNGFILHGAPSQSGYNPSLYNEYASAYPQSSPSMFIPGTDLTFAVPSYYNNFTYSTNSYQEQIAAKPPNTKYYGALLTL